MAFDGGKVGLTYADMSEYDFVSISGTGTVIRDKAKMKALWTKMVDVWFLGGLGNPDLALLKVEVETAEYWESPSSPVVRLFGVAKALVTGDPSSLGKDQKIKVKETS